MASVSTNRRPFSEQFIRSPVSSLPVPVEHCSSQPRPRTSVTSHYRPFSTLYADSILESLPPPKPRPHSIIRPISSSGLHAFASMGFGFKEKPKAKEQPRLRKSSDVRPSPLSRTLSSPASQLPTRPSTSHGPTHTRAVLHRVKKKRSLSSLFSADGITVDLTSPLNSSSLASTITLSTSPTEETEDNIDTASTVKGDSSTIKGEETAVEGDDDYTVKDRFTENNVWIKRCRMKMHPYSDDAPYMQAYEPILLENDYYTDVLLRHLNDNGSPSFHDYGKQPPASVLDLGCGQGHWALQAATVWKDSIITTLDLVDIILPAFDGLDNLKFVRGNFVKYELPFADNTFEFVRMANLSLCIPYEKWEFVLSEVHRVLTIGGRLELIDDQIFFPYGPVPTPVDHLSSPSFSKAASIVDLDFDEEDLLDDIDDSRMSAETGSTFISDEDSSSASSCEHPQGSLKLQLATPTPLSSASSTTPTLDPLGKQRILGAFNESIATPVPSEAIGTPVLPTTVLSSSPAPRSSSWEREAAASRDLERVFEDMLNKKSGIHPRPSEFVPELMNLVFGKENADKMKSYHIKMAPPTLVNGSDSALVASGSGSSTDIVPEKEDSTISAVAESARGVLPTAKKTWLNIDWEKKEREKKEKKERKEQKKEKKKTKDEDIAISNGVGAAASPVATEIPSAKAAVRLGISYSALVAVAKEEEKRRIEKDRKDKRDSAEQSAADATPTVYPARPTREVVSAKAAGRLGISYSALAAASAASTRRRYSPPISSIPAQSPGIIIWPSTFIPLSPSELEMHACKHIHVLLGCKPALAEWVDSFIDEEGGRIVEYNELCEALWGYECFRRARFNWPSEVPDSFAEEEEQVFDQSSAHTPRLATTRSFSISSTSGLPRSTSDTSNINFGEDELTHLRTIRVYHATKGTGSSLTSLLFPHSPRSPQPSITFLKKDCTMESDKLPSP